LKYNRMFGLFKKETPAEKAAREKREEEEYQQMIKEQQETSSPNIVHSHKTRHPRIFNKSQGGRRRTRKSRATKRRSRKHRRHH